MEGKFTITLTLQKKDHSLQIHSDDSPGLMWSIAAIRQAIDTDPTFQDLSNLRAGCIVVTLVCDLSNHSIEWYPATLERISKNWSNAIFQQALEHLNNEQRFLFAVIKQKEMAEVSRFQGMITDMRRQ